MFYVGQKVVCIKKGPWHCAITGAPDPRSYDPVEGKIYTIEWVQLGTRLPVYDEKANGLYLYLVEIQQDNASYHAIFFRPLVERPTDISVFTKILNHDPVKTPQGA